ncbi:MAG: SBBP repeat-containing protein, partial [Bryobacteraceae bacterium]
MFIGPVRTMVWLVSAVGLLAVSTDNRKSHLQLDSGVKPFNSSAQRSGRLFFEPNTGQAEPSVDYIARSRGQTVLVSGNEATLLLNESGRSLPPVRMRLTGARDGARPEALEKLPGISNYFVGNDPKRWRTRVPHFAKVRYRDVYPGIDLLYYGSGTNLEYDLIVAPGADPGTIQLTYEGVQAIRTEENGDLLLQVSGTSIRQRAPVVYQLENGLRQPVSGSYVSSGGRVRLALGSYDKGRPLIIDPVIEFSTYLGAAGYESGVAIALDSNGSSYITGVTSSQDFPGVRRESAQRQHGGATDTFVAKFSQYGGQLVYVTYLGGKGTDTGNSILVDSTGAAYIGGDTMSEDFPTRNAVQHSYGGGADDAFVTKLSPAGDALLFSTHIGGSGGDFGNGLAIAAKGDFYLTGWRNSTDFPMRSPYQAGPAGG